MSKSPKATDADFFARDTHGDRKPFEIVFASEDRGLKVARERIVRLNAIGHPDHSEKIFTDHFVLGNR